MSSKARGPRRDDLTAPDGSLLTHCRQNCERGLTTIFGDVTVRRKGYRIAGVESLFPLDLDLNLAQDKYSHGLRRRVAEQVAGNSFTGLGELDVPLGEGGGLLSIELIIWSSEAY